MDGQPAENLPTVTYYFRLSDSTDPVQLVILRGAAQQTLSITPVEHRGELDSVSAMADPEKNLVRNSASWPWQSTQRISAASPALSDPYGIIVVARSRPGRRARASPAERHHPQPEQRSNRPTLQGLRDVPVGRSPGRAVTLQIQRDGRLMYVSFTLE